MIVDRKDNKFTNTKLSTYYFVHQICDNISASIITPRNSHLYDIRVLTEFHIKEDIVLTTTRSVWDSINIIELE
jgi:hypothetical protein